MHHKVASVIITQEATLVSPITQTTTLYSDPKRQRVDLSRQYRRQAYPYRIGSQKQVVLILRESNMSIGLLKYSWKISGAIRTARRQGAISGQESDYLKSKVSASDAASSTAALISARGTPDFLYAALYFSTLLWQSGEAAQCDANAKAGFKLAQFILSQESPAHESYWAAKLLRELYEPAT